MFIAVSCSKQSGTESTEVIVDLAGALIGGDNRVNRHGTDTKRMEQL